MIANPDDVWAPPTLPTSRGSARRAWRRIWPGYGQRREAGMVTVEYAIGTIAAAALATLLWTIARSPGVEHLIQEVFSKALTIP